jgi:hypothetical protein
VTFVVLDYASLNIFILGVVGLLLSRRFDAGTQVGVERVHVLWIVRGP